MSDYKGKTSSFLKAINKYAEEQRLKIQNEIEEFKRQELEKAETEILNDTYILIQKEMAEMKSKISKELCINEMQGKKQLFEKRKSIMEKVFDEVRQRLLDFTKTDEYIEFIKEGVKKVLEVLNGSDVILYIRKEDENLINNLKSNFVDRDFKIEVIDNIYLGGVLGYSLSAGIIADETLDSKFEEQKKWFAENSGLKVSR